MKKRLYITPRCTNILVQDEALLTASVLPEGTKKSDQTDATATDWETHNTETGAVGIGGDEFKGDDW